MVKVYFACSIRGGRENAAIYPQLVGHIKKSAHVLSESFADKKLTAKTVLGTSAELRQHCLDMIADADVVIAEVTTPSLGVGFEIATAEAAGKPVLALFRNGHGNLSAMIGGSNLSTIVYYDDLNDAVMAIDSFLASSAESS
jgi:nucleoside 2-deoxyribosyltransferase